MINETLKLTDDFIRKFLKGETVTTQVPWVHKNEDEIATFYDRATESAGHDLGVKVYKDLYPNYGPRSQSFFYDTTEEFETIHRWEVWVLKKKELRMSKNLVAAAAIFHPDLACYFLFESQTYSGNEHGEIRNPPDFASIPTVINIDDFRSEAIRLLAQKLENYFSGKKLQRLFRKDLEKPLPQDVLPPDSLSQYETYFDALFGVLYWD